MTSSKIAFLAAVAISFSDLSSAQTTSTLYIPSGRELLQSGQRTTDVSVAASEATLSYISALSRKIEQIAPPAWPTDGTGHRLYGTILVTMSVGPDGSLLDLQSGAVRLDNAIGEASKQQFADATANGLGGWHHLRHRPWKLSAATLLYKFAGHLRSLRIPSEVALARRYRLMGEWAGARHIRTCAVAVISMTGFG